MTPMPCTADIAFVDTEVIASGSMKSPFLVTGLAGFSANQCLVCSLARLVRYLCAIGWLVVFHIGLILDVMYLNFDIGADDSL